MKKLTTITLSLLLSITTFAQTYITQVKPYKEKLWGYIDQNGKTIIDAKYSKCYQFSENGLAPIYESKKFSFINTKGETITTAIDGYKLIEGFIGIGGLQGYQDGMVAVMKDKKWGFMNTEGQVSIELKYDKVSSFNDGFATTNSGNIFFVINKSGSEMMVEGADLTSIKSMSEGLAPFTDSKKESGYVDTKGKVAIPAQFIGVGYFSDGLAWAKSSDKTVGFIDQTGNWVINPQFDVAKNFDQISGLARVKSDGSWTYVNKNGEIINISDTETWGDFYDGLARGKKDGKTGYYDNKGHWVIPPQYDSGRDFKNGYAAVKKDDKWGFIDKSGNWVIEAKYAAVKDMEKVD